MVKQFLARIWQVSTPHDIISRRRENTQTSEEIRVGPLGWQFDQDDLEHLFSKLSQIGLIECESEIFSAHFTTWLANSTARIRWYGTITELIHMILELMRLGAITPRSSRYRKVILDHFVKPDGSRFSETTISSSKRKVISAEMHEWFENVLFRPIL